MDIVPANRGIIRPASALVTAFAANQLYEAASNAYNTVTQLYNQAAPAAKRARKFYEEATRSRYVLPSPYPRYALW